MHWGFQRDGRLLFWDADEDAPVQNILDPNRMRLNCISMSPSGRFVAVCGEDHQTKVHAISLGTDGSSHAGKCVHSEFDQHSRW